MARLPVREESSNGRIGRMRWPTEADSLVALQQDLGQLAPESWTPVSEPLIAGCFVCFGRGGSGAGIAGETGWAAAASMRGRRLSTYAVTRGPARFPYEPGLLAAREGPLLDQAVRGLSRRPDVLIVNATGRDHPWRAGLALHLGWALDLPSLGVTHRPLIADGAWPDAAAGSRAPLAIDHDQVGCWLRTRRGARPVAVTAGWRTDPELAAELVMATVAWARTPEPLRQARRLARTARSTDSGLPGESE